MMSKHCGLLTAVFSLMLSSAVAKQEIAGQNHILLVQSTGDAGRTPGSERAETAGDVDAGPGESEQVDDNWRVRIQAAQEALDIARQSLDAARTQLIEAQRDLDTLMKTESAAVDRSGGADGSDAVEAPAEQPRARIRTAREALKEARAALDKAQAEGGDVREARRRVRRLGEELKAARDAIRTEPTGTAETSGNATE